MRCISRLGCERLEDRVLLAADLAAVDLQILPDPLNNLAVSVEPLAVVPPLSPSHDPDHSIAVGRTLSAYTTQDISGDEVTVTYTVYNLLPAPVSGVLLTTTLSADVALVSSSVPPDQNTQELAWNLGTLSPFGSATVEVTVSRGASNPLILDDGPEAFAHVDGVAVADELAPAVLRTDAIDPALLAATLDANSADPFIRAKAAELNQNATEIFEFVRDGVGFESYAGSLRGSRGTLWSSAGNALDQASLMVALLRASGVPARYAEGILDDAQAQQLILSMFPASFQAVGLIPAGAELADPASDPQLLAETRGHFWTQFDAGPGFQDADPTFAGAAIGDTFTTADGTFSEVADGLRHKLTVRLDRELAIPAVGLFTGGSPLSLLTVLEHTFTSAELVGQPLTIGHIVNNNTLVTPIVTAVTNTYSPYLAVGDEGLSLEESEVIRGTDFQEFITNFPLGTQVLTGLFLEVELSGPDGPAETHRTALVDRIGFDIRQNGGTPNLQIGADTPPLVTESDAFTLIALPGLGNPRRSDALPNEVQSVLDRLEDLPPDDTSPETRHLGRILPQGMTRVFGDVFRDFSDVQTEQLARAAHVRAYADRPRLVISSSRFEPDAASGTAEVTFSLDLRRDTVRTVPYPGQNEDEASRAFRTARGIFESVVERSVLDTLPGAAVTTGAVSAASVFAAADEQNIALALIGPSTLLQLDGLDISSEAKARITQTVSAGRSVIVPAQTPLVDGEPAIAWYDVDPLTGETIGVSEDGSHGGLLEYTVLDILSQIQSAIQTASRSALLAVTPGSLIGVAYSICSLTGDTTGCKALAARAKLDTIAIVDKIAKQADISTEIFGLTLNTTVKAFAHVDPPVPRALANPLPGFPFPENTGSAQVDVSSNVPAGAVAGAVDTPHAKIGGSLHVNWTTATKVGLSVTTLDAALAVVLDETGATVGTGVVSLDEATWASISCKVSYDVTGHGTLSSYASATSGLGISGQWDDYALTLSDGAAIELTTAALVLNGMTLPAGKYTITTNSASLTGSGASTAPNFVGSVLIDVTDGTVLVGPSDQDLSVGGAPIDTSQGLALSGFAGTATIVSDTTLDTLTLLGTAGQVLRVFGSPAVVSADQNTPATFEILVETSLSGPYTLQAEAPADWTVAVDDTGTVTLTLPPGLQGGAFPIRLSAQSLTDPALVAHAEVMLAVAATAPGVALDVQSDPLFFVPFAGSQVPTAYQATVHNQGPDAETFELTFPAAPAGFEILASTDLVTVPAGETAVVGLYLNPVGLLPAPGTGTAFTVLATSTSNAAITDTQIVPFIVPEIHGLILLADPPAVSTLPGVGVPTVLVVEARGNVIENVTFELAASAGLIVDGLQPLTLDPGELQVLFLTLTPESGTPLNSALAAAITANFGAPEAVTLQIPVDVVAPGVESVAEAAVFVRDFLGNVDLANRLDDLGVALTNLAQQPASEVFQSQAVASLDSILTLLAVDPILVNYVDDFQGPRDELAAAETEADVLAALSNLGAALDGFADAVFFRNEFNFELFLLPNTQVALPQTPIQYELRIHHIGGVSEGTYNIGLSGLPATVTGDLSDTQVTLDRDEFASVLVTLTQTSADELLAFDFSVDVSVEGFPEIAKSAVGSMTVRNEIVNVVSVEADPPFTNPGGQVDVSARILNAVNRGQDALVTYTVFSSNGVAVFMLPVPISVSLTVQASLVTVELGTLDTTGFPLDDYAIEVTVLDALGDPIPGARGRGALLVGSPVTASLSVAPQLLPPGTSTVHNTLEIDARSALIPPLSLVGVGAAGGAGDAVRFGDLVYVATTSGIRVFDVTDRSNPQLLGTFGTAAGNLEIRGDKLVAMRGTTIGGSTAQLSIYSLAVDPANPTLLGSTPELPYFGLFDLLLTDTHAYVAALQFLFLGPATNANIVAQSGDLLSIDISNPAAPFLADVLVNTFGTNNDFAGVVFGVDQSGGPFNVFNVEQVDASTLYIATTTSAGGNPNVGSGRVRVVDISNPANMTVIEAAELQIPGTVQLTGLAIDGERAFVVASSGGWTEPDISRGLAGTIVLTTLDISDPRDPQLINQQTLARRSRGLGATFEPVGDGLYAFGVLGDPDDPHLMLLNTKNPLNLTTLGTDLGTDANANVVGLSGGDGFIYTADAAGLKIYEIGDAAPVPATVEVQVPKGTGVEVVAGSFNVPPTAVIPGSNFDTLVWDLLLDDSSANQTLSWNSEASDLQPGESRAVTLDTTIDFTALGASGQLTLPPQNVFVEQVLVLDPASQTVQPGQPAVYTVTIANPAALDVTYDLSVAGVPQEWGEFAAQTTVPAGGFVNLTLTLTSDPFAALADYGFVVTATTGGTSGSVEGTLVLEGAPLLPEADPVAHGVVVTLEPVQANAGQGTAADYVARVTNTGSATDNFVLFVSGLPPAFSATFGAGIVEVPPGASNFLDVSLTIVPPDGAPAGDYPFTVTAASATDASITDDTAGLVTVFEIGVAVEVTPASGGPGSAFQVMVTNTGEVAETFDLTLAGPAALFSALQADTVTLDPNESAIVTIDVGPIEVSFPGGLSLVAVATSQSIAAIQASDEAQVMIPESRALDTHFDPDIVVLPAPGATTSVLRVDNLGNTEDAYEATIIDTTGPIVARLIRFEGPSADTIPLFRMPGLSTGAIALEAELQATGVGTVTVRVTSLSDPTITSDAVFFVQTHASDELVDLVVVKTESADPVVAGSGAGNLVYTVTVTNAGPSDAADVVLSEDLTLPPGVTVDSITPSQGAFTPGATPDGTWAVGDLANGASATLTVVLTVGASTVDGAVVSDTASVVSIGAGQTLVNTDDDSDTESTTVERQAGPPALHPTATKDDGDWGYRERGSWQSGTGGWMGDIRARSAGTSGNTATWSLAVTAGVYQLYASWTAADNQAAAAPYKIYDGSALVAAVTRNQQLAPDDGTYDGKTWESLGVYTITKNSVSVILTQAAVGGVVADGIIAVPVMPLAVQRGAAGEVVLSPTVKAEELGPIFAEAVSRWAAAGASRTQLQAIEQTAFVVTDLPDPLLGLASQETVWIDDDAAGRGWFVDPTPADNAEFSYRAGGIEWRAETGSPAFGWIDLLTVVGHELGHVMGLEHHVAPTLMGDALAPGTRRLPSAVEDIAHGDASTLPSPPALVLEDPVSPGHFDAVFALSGRGLERRLLETAAASTARTVTIPRAPADAGRPLQAHGGEVTFLGKHETDRRLPRLTKAVDQLFSELRDWTADKQGELEGLLAQDQTREPNLLSVGKW